VREEATCSICLHLMAEPVSISCGHSYCQACLLRFMGPSSSPRRQQYRETFSCPQCRASCHRGSLRPNKQLGSLIAALREQEQEQQQQEQEQEQELSCQEHGERLHLFCEDDGQLICWRCERDGQHKGHNTVLVEDASTGYREKLQEAVRKLRQLEEECTNQKAITATQIAQWEEKIEAQRQKIQADFQKLRSFLREEERSYLWRLESERARTLKRLRGTEANLGHFVNPCALREIVKKMEQYCQGCTLRPVLLSSYKHTTDEPLGSALHTPVAQPSQVQTLRAQPSLLQKLRANSGFLPKPSIAPPSTTESAVGASGSGIAAFGRGMASASASKKMWEEATCSICLHLMAEPVSISCSHSYCQACLLRFVGPPSSPRSQQNTDTFSCPQCQAPLQRGSLRPNKQLGSLIAALREQEQEQEQEQELSCEEHGERLHLFCEDDGQLICWRCERHGQHKGHNTVLVEDVSPGYREKLQEAVRKLRQLEEECTNQKAFTAKQITQWKEKIEAQRQKIQVDFQNLHSFLREEERSYLWRLESEEQRTLQRLRGSEADLGQQSLELESHILELEERCQGSFQKLLQIKANLFYFCGLWQQVQGPDYKGEGLGAVCSPGGLSRQLLSSVPSIYIYIYILGVTLDPETAHPELIVSQDQRQVTRGPQREADTSPWRFMASPCILGRQSFASGRRYFEVDVGEGTGWDVGVCLESVQRLGGTTQRPETGFWALRLGAKDGYVALTWPRTPLRLQERPLVVGVLLDCEVGLVSFYSGTSGSHMFTFPRAAFPDALRPYLQVYPYSPLFLPSPDE
uniref:Tripartite motif containing 38 n=1 Tax=Myotis lucifugus TaxID=59463 RepID=G1PX55_MYOLU